MESGTDGEALIENLLLESELLHDPELSRWSLGLMGRP